MNLTDSTRVKKLLEQGGGSVKASGQLEALITQQIPLVSAVIEQRLGRGVLVAERTEYFDLESGQDYVPVFAFPIDTSANLDVFYDLDAVFPASSELGATEYRVTSHASGIALRSALLGGPRVLKVVYTGGMAADLSALAAGVFAPLVEAATMQVVYQVQRRPNLGATVLAAGPGSATFNSEYGLLQHVAEIVDGLRPRMVTA